MNTNDIAEFIKIALVMILVDAAWISAVAGSSFKTMTESIQKSSMVVKPLGAILAYVAMTTLFFTFRKDLTLVKAFLLGMLSYAIYDFTNYALFTGWKLSTAIIDTLWGGILFLVTKLVYDIV